MVRTEQGDGAWKTESEGGPALGLEPGAWVVVQFEALVHDHRGHPGEVGKPVPGATASLHRIRALGCRILIDSARPEFAVRAYMEGNGLPFDEILAGPGRSSLFTVVQAGEARTFSGEWGDVAIELYRTARSAGE